MDEDRKAWLAALRANPNDWGMRGIFADWLDDHGEHDLAAGYRAICLFQLVRVPDTAMVHFAHTPDGAFLYDFAQTFRDARCLVPTSWYEYARRISSVDNEEYLTEDEYARAWSMMTTEERQQITRLMYPPRPLTI